MTIAPKFTESSGNVFADLGLPDPETRLAKAELARRITSEIQERNPTQSEAAEILRIDQPRVSAITRGRISDFSLDQLMTLLGRLDLDIEIVVSVNPEPERASRLVVHNVALALATSK